MHRAHRTSPFKLSQQSIQVVISQRNDFHVHDGVSQEAFVAMRTARDAGLSMPALILPAVQVNMRAGHFPAPEANGVTYLKLPVNAV